MKLWILAGAPDIMEFDRLLNKTFVGQGESAKIVKLGILAVAPEIKEFVILFETRL